MSFRIPLTVKAKELVEMQKKGIVVIKWREIDIEGNVENIMLASNDPSEFGSFDFYLTPETLNKHTDLDPMYNFTAFEIEGIKLKD